MKAYTILNKDWSARAECMLYTFEELKRYFEPGAEDAELEELHRKWEEIADLYDLKEFLKLEACGDAQPYSFETVEIKDLDQLKRMNGFLYSDELEEELLK